LAWAELCEKLEQQHRTRVEEATAAREKLRRQKRGKSRAQKQRMTEDKRHTSRLKSLRGRVTVE
jgi:peptide chain release factor